MFWNVQKLMYASTWKKYWFRELAWSALAGVMSHCMLNESSISFFWYGFVNRMIYAEHEYGLNSVNFCGNGHGQLAKFKKFIKRLLIWELNRKERKRERDRRFEGNHSICILYYWKRNLVWFDFVFRILPSVCYDPMKCSCVNQKIRNI